MFVRVQLLAESKMKHVLSSNKQLSSGEWKKKMLDKIFIVMFLIFSLCNIQSLELNKYDEKKVDLQNKTKIRQRF